MLSGMTSMAGAAASAGGGALLTLDTPPADQALASGSTSSSGITFAAPTGGSGSYSYAAVLDTVAATGTPALSGSGLGPYTVTGLSDGDLCVVRMTYTDTVTGQTAEQGVAVGVAQAAGGGGGGYSTVTEVDLTDGDVTAGSTSTAGAFTIYASDGTTPRATGILTLTSGTATVSWDSTGIRIVCSGTAFVAFQVPTGSLADINKDWHVDSIIEPLVSPASSYMLAYLGNTASSSALSVGWDLQNNAQKIEARRTLSGPSYSWGLTDTLSGVLPSASACRIESRGGAAMFVAWDKTGAGYLADDWSGTTSDGRAHATAQSIGASDIWTAGGGAYFGFGGTTGVDVKVQKFRIRERA